MDELIKSRRVGSDDEIDRAWAAELERRVARLDRGEAKVLDGEEVFARLVANLRNR